LFLYPDGHGLYFRILLFVSWMRKQEIEDYEQSFSYLYCGITFNAKGSSSWLGGAVFSPAGVR